MRKRVKTTKRIKKIALRKVDVQMRCPNCRLLVVKKKAGKFLCRGCGWFEKVGREWRCSGGLETVSPVASQSRDIAGKYTKRSPKPKVRKILGGLVTITEVDN